MVKGHLPAAHPLDVAEIDHTPMNLYVIDDSSLIPLGRPLLALTEN
jgi:putative transposase